MNKSSLGTPLEQRRTSGGNRSTHGCVYDWLEHFASVAMPRIERAAGSQQRDRVSTNRKLVAVMSLALGIGANAEPAEI